MIMVVGIPFFQEALRKLGLGGRAPEDETSAVPEGESRYAPPEEAVGTPEEAPFGVIQEGAWAYLCIYSDNPLADIEVLVDYEANLKVVMKNGVVYKNAL